MTRLFAPKHTFAGFHLANPCLTGGKNDHLGPPQPEPQDLFCCDDPIAFPHISGFKGLVGPMELDESHDPATISMLGRIGIMVELRIYLI